MLFYTSHAWDGLPTADLPCLTKLRGWESLYLLERVDGFFSAESTGLLEKWSEGAENGFKRCRVLCVVCRAWVGSAAMCARGRCAAFWKRRKNAKLTRLDVSWNCKVFDYHWVKHFFGSVFVMLKTQGKRAAKGAPLTQTDRRHVQQQNKSKNKSSKQETSKIWQDWLRTFDRETIEKTENLKNEGNTSDITAAIK